MDIFHVHFNFNKTASGMSWSDDRAFPLALVACTGAGSQVKIPQSLLEILNHSIVDTTYTSLALFR